MRICGKSRGDQLGWAAPIYVADSDELAKDEARAGIESLFNEYLANPWEMLLPPGYTSLQSMKNTMPLTQIARLTRAQSDDRTIDGKRDCGCRQLTDGTREN